MKTFTILGLGWLGHPLSYELKNKYKIKASVRNDERLASFKDELKKDDIDQNNFELYVLNEYNLENLDALLDTDYLFINYPPSKFDDYISFLSKIYSHKKINNIEKIFFVSSTSIYPDLNEEFHEDYIISKPKRQNVYDCEEFIKNKTNYILRASGLMGYNRVAGRYFSGKVVKDSKSIVNFVHRDDVISAVEFILNNKITDGIYNLVSPSYPTKEEIYTNNCEKLNIPLPTFTNVITINNRKVNTKKLLESGFSYKFNNPLEYM